MPADWFFPRPPCWLRGDRPRNQQQRRPYHKQETGDYRWKIAVEHLIDMPVARREGRGQSEFAHKDREPDQDRETRLVPLHSDYDYLAVTSG